MADSHSDLFSDDVRRVAPPVHNEFFVCWSVCSATFAILVVPGGLLLVRSLRADEGPHSGGAMVAALPFRDQYVAPERTAVRAPPRCLLPEEPTNLTFDLAKQYAPKLAGLEAAPAVTGSKKALQVFCYYNKSRVTWLQGGQSWFGVASVPFSFCRYVIYGPMRLDGWTASIKTTARDVILIEQLRSAVTSGSGGKNASSSLLVSVSGRGEFTDLRRSAGNVR
ncbi:hypothetical protein V5799_027926 [Amblyomma americanum]|uniref:Uncharacterized protein n=1 Tax=Amblyomma americanum TaxID=6943 RepID=A0AAQ4DEB6_AMBAM